VAYAIFDTPAIHGIPGIKELHTLAVGWSAADHRDTPAAAGAGRRVRHDLRGYVVVGLGSPDAPLAFDERLQVCLLAADQTGWSAQMG
jgi:hypothetical protein